MLVGDYIIFVFWVYGLVVQGHEDLVGFELGGAKVFKEVGVAGTREVDVGVLHVFGLEGVSRTTPTHLYD